MLINWSDSCVIDVLMLLSVYIYVSVCVCVCVCSIRKHIVLIMMNEQRRNDEKRTAINTHTHTLTHTHTHNRTVSTVHYLQIYSIINSSTYSMSSEEEKTQDTQDSRWRWWCKISWSCDSFGTQNLLMMMMIMMMLNEHNDETTRKEQQPTNNNNTHTHKSIYSIYNLQSTTYLQSTTSTTW